MTTSGNEVMCFLDESILFLELFFKEIRICIIHRKDNLERKIEWQDKWFIYCIFPIIYRVIESDYVIPNWYQVQYSKKWVNDNIIECVVKILTYFRFIFQIPIFLFFQKLFNLRNQSYLWLLSNYLCTFSHLFAVMSIIFSRVTLRHFTCRKIHSSFPKIYHGSISLNQIIIHLLLWKKFWSKKSF